MTLIQKSVLLLIRAYQLTLSFFLGNQCRYHPTCSHYAMDAVRQYGALRGSILGFQRVMRCHPFRAGGYDPVPPCLDIKETKP